MHTQPYCPSVKKKNITSVQSFKSPGRTILSRTDIRILHSSQFANMSETHTILCKVCISKSRKIKELYEIISVIVLQSVHMLNQRLYYYNFGGKNKSENLLHLMNINKMWDSFHFLNEWYSNQIYLWVFKFEEMLLNITYLPYCGAFSPA